MQFLPFPLDVAKECAAKAALHYRQNCRKRFGIGDKLRVPGFAAYQMPDGAIRPVHDPYRPEYPEGATPGIGTRVAVLEAYPGDATGWRDWIERFRPLTPTPSHSVNRDT